jgi:hypothetical protein
MTTFYKNTEVVVLEASASLSKVRLVGQEDYQAVWVPNRLLEQREVKPTTKVLAVCSTSPEVVSRFLESTKFADVPAVTVEQALVPFVKRLRILHAPKASTYLQEQASKQGVILDPRTRPINVGENSKGMRSAAAEIEFSKDTPTNILPNGYRVRPNGRYRVNSLAVAFALLKAGAKQTAFA